MSEKTPPFYIWNNSAKHEPILIIFVVQNPEEMPHQKLIQARWVSLQFSDVKFPPDSAHQKFLKSVHFTPIYSKYKKGEFLRHSVDRCVHLE